MSVLIYGATGFTGRLVAAALERRGVTFVLSGRDRHRLEAIANSFAGDIEIRVARVHDAAEMSAAMADNAVVINCAGPFSTLGELVVRAAVAAKVHYLDTTGEQEFMRAIYERFDSVARRAGVVVVNGCAFEIALGDWAAARAASGLDGECDQLFIAYAIQNFRATSGTQMAALDSLSRDAVEWNVDRWETVRPAAERKLIRFPEPFGERTTLSFPSGEVISVPRHIHTGRVQTYISMFGDSPGAGLFSLATQLGALTPVLPLLLRSPLMTAARARVGQSGEGPSEAERRKSAFSIVAEAERSFERKRVCISGSDPYGVAAEIIAYAADTLLTGAQIKPGVLAPSQLIDAQLGLQTVAEMCLLEVTHS